MYPYFNNDAWVLSNKLIQIIQRLSKTFHDDVEEQRVVIVLHQLLCVHVVVQNVYFTISQDPRDFITL